MTIVTSDLPSNRNYQSVDLTRTCLRCQKRVLAVCVRASRIVRVVASLLPVVCSVDGG